MKTKHKFLAILALAILFNTSASAATYVAVSTANGIDEYIVNGNYWTYNHQIIARTGLYGVTYNPADGLLYAADAVVNQVFSVDPTNGTQTTLATLGDNTPGWTADNPQNIAFGPDGKLYFSTAFGTPTSQGIFSMNPDGTDFSQFIAETGTNWTLGRARDLTWVGTNLYVTSRDNNNVYEFDNTGALVGTGAVNSAAVSGASSIFADTNSNILYVGCNKSGANSIHTLNIGGALPVTPGSATDSSGKATLGIINIDGAMFYITFDSGTSGHGSIYRLNPDKSSAVVVADLGATANDFTVMSDADIGPLESINIQFLRANMIAGTFQQATVLANYQLITNDISMDPGVVYSSDNTNVLTISSSGEMNAVNVGTANVIATYSGQSATNPVTVIPLVTTLIHRYGFTDDASDSAGAANGTVYGFDYDFSNGQLDFLPTSEFDYNYVDFGPDVISGNDAITFEAWASFGTNYTWARLFDFGDNDGVTGTSYVLFTPISSAGTARVTMKTPTGGSLNFDAPDTLDGQTNVQVVVVFHPLAGYIKLYINGVLAAQDLNVSGQDLANVVDNYSYLGKSQAYVDPAANELVDEFRIYSGALDATNVALDYAAGPDSIVTDPGALESIALEIDTNMLQQGGQSVVAHGNFANISEVPLNGFPGINFTSDNTNILTINSDGAVKAVGFGTATITAIYDDQSVSYTVTIAPLSEADFLVADGGNDQVLKYHAVGTNWVSAGALVSAANGPFAWGTNGDTAPLTNPFALAQDTFGNVYVGEQIDGGRVLKFTGNGSYLATLGTEGIDFTGQPDCLVFGPDGNLYMSTAFGTNASDHILKFDVSSNVWSEFVSQSASPNGLTKPRGIAFDPAGNLYVSERGQSSSSTGQMVQEFDTNGAYIQDLAGGLVGPQALSYDATNSRFIVSVKGALDAIDTNGVVTPLATGAGASIQDALSVGPNVFYTDYSGSGVYAVTSGSTSTLVAGGMTHAAHLVLAQFPPDLNVTLTEGSAVISWPYSLQTYHLQSSPGLSPADWQDVGSAPTQTGNIMQVTLPVSNNELFFRLRN